jgi:hypothetical protein
VRTNTPCARISADAVEEVEDVENFEEIELRGEIESQLLRFEDGCMGRRASCSAASCVKSVSGSGEIPRSPDRPRCAGAGRAGMLLKNMLQLRVECIG